MIDSLRNAAANGIRWSIAVPEVGVTHLVYDWPERIDAELAGQMVELMRHTTASAPIIGFAEEISDADAAIYLRELDANLAARKCRLLAIRTDAGQLIGLCTLRRNLNPNNAHITDLAKGMIREEFRGGAVLPAAFYEIALRCEADGVDIVTLDVRADTPAHRAWDRFGFQTWGVLPDYARAKGRVHAGHFMMQRVADLKAKAVKTFEAKARQRADAEAQPA
jgi:RimJ/RimL family protein N-acetyltransferase